MIQNATTSNNDQIHTIMLPNLPQIRLFSQTKKNKRTPNSKKKSPEFSFAICIRSSCRKAKFHVDDPVSEQWAAFFPVSAPLLYLSLFSLHFFQRNTPQKPTAATELIPGIINGYFSSNSRRQMRTRLRHTWWPTRVRKRNFAKGKGLFSNTFCCWKRFFEDAPSFGFLSRVVSAFLILCSKCFRGEKVVLYSNVSIFEICKWRCQRGGP